MASFPSAVKSFASRSNGQTIDAGHVGDIQDEVNAIEDGYLNGTARLNSSNSTVANLSVTGKSTLASTLTIGTIPYAFPSSGGSTGHVLTCVSTSGSTMGLEWRSPSASTPDAVRVFLDAAQEFGAASSGAILWTGQSFITNSSMHSTATNPSHLRPQSSGVYLFTCNVHLTGAASTRAVLDILDSSGGVLAYDDKRVPSGGTFSLSGSGLKYFDSVVGSTQWIRSRLFVVGSTARVAVSGSFCSLNKL